MVVSTHVVIARWGGEDHIHTYRGHGVACRGTVHLKLSWLGGD